MSVLVSSGAGFVGSDFVLEWFAKSDGSVFNLDQITYPGNIKKLKSLNGDHLGPTFTKTLRYAAADRPGHDRSYAIDVGMIEADLGWKLSDTLTRASDCHTVALRNPKQGNQRPVRSVPRLGREKLHGRIA